MYGWSRTRVEYGMFTSKTAGDFAGTSLDSPKLVNPGDDIISICHGDPKEKRKHKIWKLPITNKLQIWIQLIHTSLDGRP